MKDEERAFFSCLLNKPVFLDDIKRKIKPEYFSDDEGKTLYKLILEAPSLELPILSSKNIPFDYLVSIQETIKRVTETQMKSYAWFILEEYKKREIIRLATAGEIDSIQDIKNLSIDDDEEIDESQVFLQNLQDIIDGKQDLRCVPTGYYSLDSRIGGVRKSEFVVVGARPGVGKTSWGMNVAVNIARKHKKVLFCSIEMGRLELHERIVKSLVRIGDFKNLTAEQTMKVIETSRRVKSELPLHIYDKPAMKFEDIVYIAKKEKPDILIIDHLAILRTNRIFKSRYEETSFVTSQLKALSRELDIPVICLAQLNRQVEGRELKAPNMADLRDSGSIEEDADLVFFLYRPEYNLKKVEPDDKNSDAYFKWKDKMDDAKGKAFLILEKNRRGWTGRTELKFEGENYLFTE